MKRNYWPLFFIGIFSFVFAMIVWTIMSASKVPVNNDEAFLTSYQDVDNNYNKIVLSNQNFEKKYDFKLSVNGKKFGLVYTDMFLAQRVIEKVSKHKDIFSFGSNELKVTITDKKTGKTIEDFDIKLRISRPTNHDATMDFNEKEFKVNLPLKGNWNITGQVKVADDIGYFYIKSNAR